MLTIFFNNIKYIIANKAPQGTVITHEEKILRTTFKLSAPIPRARPTPSNEPTSVCVVETGNPNPEEIIITIAVAICAEKLREGVSAVILDPTVSMIL